MIYLNYVLYDLNKDESYLELEKYCEKLGYPIILKRSPSFTKRIQKVGKKGSTKGRGFKTHISPKFFDYNATERAAGGSKFWRYSLYPIKKDKEGYPEFEGDHGEFFNTLDLIFKKVDLEKLWFLLTKSNMITERKVYTIHDPEKDYRERVEKASNKSGVEFYIMSEHSPLTESKLKVIAKYFGLVGVSDMSMPRLQSNLFDRIESLERSRMNGYKEFMKATKLDKFVTFKAKLYDAIEGNIIGWLPRNTSWNWLNSEGKPMTVICQLTANDENKKMDILMDFILGSEELTDRLNRELGEEVTNVTEFNEDKLKLSISKDDHDDGYSYSELKSLCKEVPGFNSTSKRYEILVDNLKDFHNVE